VRGQAAAAARSFMGSLPMKAAAPWQPFVNCSSDATDLLNVQADAYSDLAEVLALGGGKDQASTALEQARGR